MSEVSKQMRRLYDELSKDPTECARLRKENARLSEMVSTNRILFSDGSNAPEVVDHLKKENEELKKTNLILAEAWHRMKAERINLWNAARAHFGYGIDMGIRWEFTELADYDKAQKGGK